MSAKRIVIVGGGAGGASAAARASRGFRVRNLTGSYRTWKTAANNNEQGLCMNWIVVAVIAAALLGFFALNLASFVSAQKAREFLGQGALVIDVHTPAEFGTGHLQRAVNIPLSGLGEEVLRRVPDKDQVLLLHCQAGKRSAMGMRQLKTLGYSRVFNLGSYGRAEKVVQESMGL